VVVDPVNLINDADINNMEQDEYNRLSPKILVLATLVSQ
jgi:hypothetical protein